MIFVLLTTYPRILHMDIRRYLDPGETTAEERQMCSNLDSELSFSPITLLL